MMNLHDHRFSPAYLLLYGRSIHQYTLQDNHFCSQRSAISPSNTVRRLTGKKRRITQKLLGNKRWFIFEPSKRLPIQQHQTLPRGSGYQKKKKKKVNGSVTFVLFVLIIGSKYQELLTLCCCLRRSLIFPHWPSPRLGGSPNESEPSPQLHQICDF